MVFPDGRIERFVVYRHLRSFLLILTILQVKCIQKWLHALEETCNVVEEGRMKDQIEDLKQQKDRLMVNPNVSGI